MDKHQVQRYEDRLEVEVQAANERLLNSLPTEQIPRDFVESITSTEIEFDVTMSVLSGLIRMGRVVDVDGRLVLASQD